MICFWAQFKFKYIFSCSRLFFVAHSVNKKERPNIYWQPSCGNQLYCGIYRPKWETQFQLEAASVARSERLFCSRLCGAGRGCAGNHRLECGEIHWLVMESSRRLEAEACAENDSLRWLESNGRIRAWLYLYLIIDVEWFIIKTAYIWLNKVYSDAKIQHKFILVISLLVFIGGFSLSRTNETWAERRTDYRSLWENSNKFFI